MNISQIPSKRLLVCTVGVPHKSKGASLVLFYHYLDGLKRSGFNILHVVLLQPDSDVRDLHAYRHEMAEQDRFEILECRALRFYKVRRVLPSITITTLGRDYVQKIAAFKPDAVLSFDIVAAAVMDKAFLGSAKRIVWLGDLNFQTYWYHALYGMKEHVLNIFKVPPIWILSRLWRNFYKRLLSKMDDCIVSSKSSESELKKLGITSQYLPYPWPEAKPTGKKVPQHFLPSFLFCGTLSGLGSRSAFHFLLRSLYPKLLKDWGKGAFAIFICGARTLPDWVIRAIATTPEIQFLGFVDDLAALMSSCHAVIVPIDVPVGNRSRIITAMAAGVPIITHRNTVLGNPDLIDGETCCLAENPEEFAKCMRRAYKEREAVLHMTLSARAVYEKKFKPDAASRMLVDRILFVMSQA